ncbi:dinitrogenase iron-molybdenum cofactor biosynthesis protein [Methanosarcinales archaeon ex4484_138]|nr:MAG: dinitrogenase iron-molybdenum cofactor biosynthesis protein [Methanosarcinales archaeon ex4484_138]RLG22993.1 MAG: dinitrogenase iron-molybdenum cofactor biosynthesis protein [Methanosarcinales archaeon]
MKICIPTYEMNGLDETVCGHFGQAPTFTVVDTESGEVKAIPNTGEHFGGSGLLPEMLSREGVHVMLCGGLGPRAIAMFEEFGIEVYVGAEGTARDTIKAWQSGQLREATDENACRENRH